MSLTLTVLLVNFFFGLVFAEGKGDYSGTQVLKVSRLANGLTDSIIKEISLNVWGQNATHVDVQVPFVSLLPVKRALAHNNIPFSVMIPDVQKAIEAEQPKDAVETRGARINWGQYQRLSAIHGYLDELAQRYNFVSVGVMGKSVENRPLKYIKISSGKPNAKIVFIDGGIHSREWISTASVTIIIRELVENRNRLPRELLDLDFYVLPVLNPDGYEYSHTNDRMWRKNRSKEYRCGGTDLNRNFDSHWAGLGTSGNSCQETYRGRGPASEPETKAVQNFLSSIRGNLKAYITFHSYGQYILIPYGYDNGKPAPGFDQMKKVGDAAAQAIRRAGGPYYTVGNTADTLYPAAGGSDDWAKEKLGVPYAFTIELRDSGSNGFILPARYIQPTAVDAFEAVKVIAAAAAKA